MIEDFQSYIDYMLTHSGIAATWMPFIKAFVLFFALVVVAYISLLISKKLLVRVLHSLFLRTKFTWDDILIEHKVFHNLAHIAPALIVKFFAPFVFDDFHQLLPFLLKVTDIYIIVVILMVITSFLRGMESLLSGMPVFKDKPLASYFQLFRIVIFITAGILMLSIMMGRSPVYFLSAFGAMTAIILLIFKDTILGLVASIQISANDMVRVGDWVEMPKYNADGDVVAMNLNTVKVKNWDKTISSIPTFYFITDSFKNWRGMQESGGRRIKRGLHINTRSIKFVDKEMKARFERIYLIKDFIATRQQEIEQYNLTHNFDTSELINGRRMTNIGVFRNYIEEFLKNHKKIRQDMTLMVRQLPPDTHGIPIEIYCFTATTVWGEYEGIQSDIFDHLLAGAKHFDLEVFQAPSGYDIVMAGEKLHQNLKNPDLSLHPVRVKADGNQEEINKKP